MNGNFIKFITWILFLIFGLFYLYSIFISYKQTEHEHATIINNYDEITAWARENLPLTGVLQENKDHFVFLKVDNGYINQLFPQLHNTNYRKPPYFRRSDSPGAHVSVIYRDEHPSGKIQEIGQPFSFQIVGIELVPPHSQEYIVLKISAPELENLRKKYGLSPLLQGHDFHITIAKRKAHLKPFKEATH